MYTIIELATLGQHQKAMAAGYRASMPLIDAGWMRHPAASWNRPAMVTVADGEVVAGVNFKEDEDDLTVSMDFAWCEPAHPGALVGLLARFRRKYRGSRFTEIRFACHVGNEAMAKAVKVLKLTPVLYSYRVTL